MNPEGVLAVEASQRFELALNAKTYLPSSCLTQSDKRNKCLLFEVQKESLWLMRQNPTQHTLKSIWVVISVIFHHFRLVNFPVQLAKMKS